MGVVTIYTNQQINENIRKKLCEGIARKIYESNEFKQSISQTTNIATKQNDTVQEAI